MYSYSIERPALFTEAGQRAFLTFRDNAHRLLKLAGAVRMQELMTAGDGWFLLACADRLIELDEIREITGPEVAGQHRVFVATRNWRAE